MAAKPCRWLPRASNHPINSSECKPQCQLFVLAKSNLFPCFMTAHTTKTSKLCRVHTKYDCDQKAHLFLKWKTHELYIWNPKSKLFKQTLTFCIVISLFRVGWGLMVYAVNIRHLAAEKLLVSLQQIRLARPWQNHLARCASSSLLSRW